MQSDSEEKSKKNCKLKKKILDLLYKVQKVNRIWEGVFLHDLEKFF